MKEGDIFESLLDGMEYVVKRIVNSLVVLQLRKGERIILTGVETLKIKSFYREKDRKVNPMTKSCLTAVRYSDENCQTKK